MFNTLQATIRVNKKDNTCEKLFAIIVTVVVFLFLHALLLKTTTNFIMT